MYKFLNEHRSMKCNGVMYKKLEQAYLNKQKMMSSTMAHFAQTKTLKSAHGPHGLIWWEFGRLNSEGRGWEVEMRSAKSAASTRWTV